MSRSSHLYYDACGWQAAKGFRAKLKAGQFSIGPSIGLKDAVVTDAIAPEADFIWYVLMAKTYRELTQSITALFSWLEYINLSSCAGCVGTIKNTPLCPLISCKTISSLHTEGVAL